MEYLEEVTRTNPTNQLTISYYDYPSMQLQSSPTKAPLSSKTLLTVMQAAT
jgi:hypothetical protein